MRFPALFRRTAEEVPGAPEETRLSVDILRFPTPSDTRRPSAGRTHVGRVRTINEDRLLDRPDRCLWAVADGMGGHSAGDVAAEAAVTALRDLADRPEPIDEGAIRAALDAAHGRIRDLSAGQGGTTVVALHLADDTATVLWAGDSRAYLVRDDRVCQLTRDHSVVQQLVDAGALAPDEAARHPKSNVITRALGASPTVELEVTREPVRPGDMLVLCSDGVSRSLVPAALPARAGESADEVACRLVSAAVERDGTDNASVVVVRV